MVIHKIHFPLYGIIIILSIFVGFIYIYINLRNKKIDKKYILYFFILYATFALICGKIYTIIVNIDKGIDLIHAGLSAYGGLLGAIIVSIFYEHIIPSNKNFIKYTVLSLPLIYGCTKIACTIAGCCYGLPYSGIFAVKYIDVIDEWLFPIQAVETILNILLFLILLKIKNNKNIISISLISVSILKFLLDFLRYDHIYVSITANQIFSILLIIVTIIALIVNKKKA